MAQVNTISQLSMDDIASSGVKKVRKSDSTFSDIMSESAKSNQDEQKCTRASDKGSASARYNESKSSAKKVESTVDQKKNNVSKNDNIVLADVMQEASKSVDAFKEKIADTLGISKEELEEIMAELGLTTMDLFDVNTLKDLVLQVNGLSDPSELLTNEAVCNQLADLLQTVDEFVQVTDMEQFMQMALIEQTDDFSTVLDEVDADGIDANRVDANGVDMIEQADAQTEEPMITVQREVAPDSEESGAKNDSKQDDQNVESQFNQFVQNLSNSTQGVDATPNSHFERLQQMQEIVDQVVENIKITLSADSTSMEIQLNPEHLGKVNLSVLAKHGQLTASFVVDNHMAKEAIESQLNVLKECLNEQGIKVEAIEVTVAEQGFSQNDFMNQGQGNFQNQAKRSNTANRMRKEDDLTEEVEEESVSINAINEGNGTVDFSA